MSLVWYTAKATPPSEKAALSVGANVVRREKIRRDARLISADESEVMKY